MTWLRGDTANSYLDYNHPQGIDVCFLTNANLSTQDLRRGPSYRVALVNGCGGLQVRNDRRKAEIRETWTSCIVDKNAWLGRRLVDGGDTFGIAAPLSSLHEPRDGNGGS